LEERGLSERKECRCLGSDIDNASTPVILNDGTLNYVITVKTVVGGGDGISEGFVGETNICLDFWVDFDLWSFVVSLDTIKPSGILGLCGGKSSC
jgi:hypothetical protein